MPGAETEVWMEPPEEITFIGPFNETKQVPIVLKNPTDYRVTFKMKSTRNRRFVMKPGYGIIRPHKDATIAVYCLKFTSRHLSTRDRITVVLAEIPSDIPRGTKPYTFWKEHTPKDPRRLVIPVIYREKPLAPEKKEKEANKAQPTPPPLEKTPKTEEKKTPEVAKKEEEKKEEETEESDEEDEETESDEESDDEDESDEDEDEDEDED